MTRPICPIQEQDDDARQWNLEIHVIIFFYEIVKIRLDDIPPRNAMFGPLIFDRHVYKCKHGSFVNNTH